MVIESLISIANYLILGWNEPSPPPVTLVRHPRRAPCISPHIYKWPLCSKRGSI